MKNKITGVLLAVAVIAVASCGGDNNAVEDASTSTTTEVEPGAPQGDDFYVPPSPLPDGKPGDIIWSDTVTSRNGLTLQLVDSSGFPTMSHPMHQFSRMPTAPLVLATNVLRAKMKATANLHRLLHRLLSEASLLLPLIMKGQGHLAYTLMLLGSQKHAEHSTSFVPHAT
jgi:hypothetical protein